MPWCYDDGVSICAGEQLSLIDSKGFDTEYVKIHSGGSSKVEKGVANQTPRTSGPPSAS